jgi:hypothetical protein
MINLDRIWGNGEYPPKHMPMAPFWRGPRKTNFLVDWEAVQYAQHVADGKKLPYTAVEIEYVLNSDGFRCIEFNQIPQDTVRLVSVGCSNTEGYALPEHHTWPHMLCERITAGTGLPVTNLNLGASAASNRTIALRSIFAMKMLHPTHMVIGWSFSSRLLYITEDGSHRDWAVPNSYERKSARSEDQPKLDYYALIQNNTWDMHNWMLDLMMVDLYAEISQTPVLHLFNWASEEETTYLRKHFAPDGAIFAEDKNDHGARDLFHPGPEYNRRLVDRIYEDLDHDRTA